MLPIAFEERMKEMLDSEYPAFLASYEDKRYQALRVNTLKSCGEDFTEKVRWNMERVPWSTSGFYYEQEIEPGKHPYHAAGVYYIQEPSAMAPAEYLEAQPGERVLDLCAAPGGKSTQMAAAMKGEGLLVANEIHPARAKILSENIERMGIRNALVTNEPPARLADTFACYFDRIMVDAPCSGEGMFRKNEDACSEWSPENVTLCAGRQDEILDCADHMLKPGGRIVYSTCTFAPEENEGSISRFIERHPAYRILPVKKYEGMSDGVPAWTDHPAAGIEHTIRLFPHKLHGEGHYVAVLEKAGMTADGAEECVRGGTERGVSEKECKEYIDFCKQYLRKDLDGNLLRFGEQLYLAPKGLPSLKGLKVLRPGLHLGTMKKNRFEPSHALALACAKEEAVNVTNLSADSKEIRDYLNGQTFCCEGGKGWHLICADGYSIGWGKLAGGVMKNHYPKGLRIHY